MKLSKKIINELAKRVKDGHNIESACASVRVGSSTYYRWLSEGRTLRQLIANDEEYEKGLSDYERLCVEFVVEVEKAQADFIEMAISEIIKNSREKKNNSGWFWLLERKFPAMFGKPAFRQVEQEEIEIPVQTPISTEQQAKDDEDKILAIIAAEEAEKDKTNDPTTDTNDA